MGWPWSCWASNSTASRRSSAVPPTTGYGYISVRGWLGPVALVLAVLSLTAGTAVGARLITGKQIKNSSVTGKDVKDSSLTKKDFKGAVGGPRGPRGFRGADGGPGPPSPVNLERVEAHTDYATDSPFIGAAIARCPAGKRVTGGGGRTDGSQQAVAITDSYPSDDMTAWIVNAMRVTGSPPWRVTAYALCASA
jgi:hypothetical protein